MDHFDDLNCYEKGVVARMLLERLIKQGRLQASLDIDEGVEIVIPVARWQMQMLAMFSEDVSQRAIKRPQRRPVMHRTQESNAPVEPGLK